MSKKLLSVSCFQFVLMHNNYLIQHNVTVIVSFLKSFLGCASVCKQPTKAPTVTTFAIINIYCDIF